MPSSNSAIPDPTSKTPSAMKVRVVGLTMDAPGSKYGPRQEDQYEFIWIMEGGVVAHFDKRVIQAEEGMVLLKRPWVKDHYEWSLKRRTVHAYIQFDLDPARRMKLSQPSVPTVKRLPPIDIFRPLFSYMLDLGSKPEPLRTNLMLSVLDLMVQAYAGDQLAFNHQPGVQVTEPLQRAIEFIHQHAIQETIAPLRLADLAEHAHTTAAYLCRLFKKVLSLSPLEYSKLVRLDRAAGQLRRTDSSLKEIGLSNGFYDVFHFSRNFKKVYGVAPKEYRESKIIDEISKRNPIVRELFKND